jgi:hypothetical protein
VEGHKRPINPIEEVEKWRVIGKSNAITESKDFIFLDLLSEDDKEQN